MGRPWGNGMVRRKGGYGIREDILIKGAILGLARNLIPEGFLGDVPS